MSMTSIPSTSHPHAAVQAMECPPPTEHLSPPPDATATPAIVLLIGSFSPITTMHLRLLELARDKLCSSGHHVMGGYISPTADAYNKPHLAPAPHRVAMTHLASEDMPWVAVDGWEAQHSRFVRTHEVASRLKRAVSVLGWDDVQVFIVCGADVVHGMADGTKWPKHSVAKLFSVARLLWIRRDGRGGEVFAPGGALEQYASRASEAGGFCWSLSSSAVRHCVKNGQSIHYMTPTPVVKYILEHGLFME